jgi:hypothetical protein
MPRGRPKGTKYLPIGATAVWLAIELKRKGGSVSRAANLVAKDVKTYYSREQTLSAERLRHLHAQVEKRKLSDTEFNKLTSHALADQRKQLSAIAASGQPCLVLPRYTEPHEHDTCKSGDTFMICIKLTKPRNAPPNSSWFGGYTTMYVARDAPGKKLVK